MPTPAQLDAAAASLRQQARGLPELIDPPIARAGCDVWQGPAQVQLWDSLRWWRARLGWAAEELVSTAGRLEGEASRIRAAEDERRRLQERPAASSVRVR